MTIPSLKSWPIIGNNIQFFSNTHQFFNDAIETNGPIFKCSLLGENQVVIADPEVASKLLNKEHKLISSSWPRATKICFGPKAPGVVQGSEHSSIRRILAKAFTPQLMKSYLASVVEQTRLQLDGWVKEEQAQPHVFVGSQRLAFNIGMRVLFGDIEVDEKKKTELFETFLTFNQSLVCLPIFFPGTVYYNAYYARKKLDKYLLPILQEFRENASPKPENLMEVLTNCPDPQTGEILSMKHIQDLSVTMLFASHDTTASAMTAIALILNHRPDVVELLTKEQTAFTKEHGESYDLDAMSSMKYIDAFVKEVQCKLMVFATLFREAKEDFQIPGYEFNVRKGQKMILETRWGQLGEEQYTKSMEELIKSFDLPGRYDLMYGSKKDEAKPPFFFFGAGKRICPGRALANIDLRVYTIELVRNYNLKLQFDGFPKYNFVPLAHPAEQVPFTVTKR